MYIPIYIHNTCKYNLSIYDVNVQYNRLYYKIYHPNIISQTISKDIYRYTLVHIHTYAYDIMMHMAVHILPFKFGGVQKLNPAF